MYFACGRLEFKELKSMSSQDDESTGKDEGEVKSTPGFILRKI
jgi:hypothetical protein